MYALFSFLGNERSTYTGKATEAAKKWCTCRNTVLFCVIRLGSHNNIICGTWKDC